MSFGTYTGRDYGSHARQRSELAEMRGMRTEWPADPRDEWEDDHRTDLEAERRGVDAPFGLMTRSTHR
jgi:hypothetical protein